VADLARAAVIPAMATAHGRRLDAGGASGDGGSRSFVDLINRLLGEVVRLLDQTVALLELELRQELGAIARSAALLAAGGVVAGLGALLLIVALAIGIGDGVGSTAGGFAIVGAVLALVGGILPVSMRRRLADLGLVPRETVRELRRDVEWIKHEL
jgi:uncharacterized membrane protein YqjE